MMRVNAWWLPCWSRYSVFYSKLPILGKAYKKQMLIDSRSSFPDWGSRGRRRSCSVL
jgi:hypothetical protein